MTARFFADTAPFGAVALGGLLLALVASVVALVVEVRGRGDEAPAWPLGAAAAGALAFVGASLVLLVDGEWLIASRLGDDPAAKAMTFAKGISWQLNGAAILGVGLANLAILAGPLWLVRLLVRGARRGAQPLVTLAAGVGGALMVAAIGVAIARWGLAAIQMFSSVAAVDPAMKTQIVELGFAEAHDMLAGGRVAVLVILALSCGAIAAAWAAERRRATSPAPDSRRPLVVGATLFVVGLGAFLATRARAADGAHPLPANEAPYARAPEEAVRVARCPGSIPDVRGPVLAVAPDGTLTVDWARVTGGDGLRDKLIAADNVRKLLHPNEASGPLVLHVLAPADMAPARVLDQLAPARALGARLVLEAEVSHPFESHTRGTLAQRGRCSLPIGAQLPDATTWGALAQRLAETGP